MAELEIVGVEIDTIAGPKTIPAPCEFDDKTALRAWSRLLNISGDIKFGRGMLRGNRRPYKRQKDRDYDVAQANALATVIADTHGMSAFYWEQVALEIAELRERGETG